jgi:hypothetical protein
LEYQRNGDKVVNEAIGVFTTGFGTAAICFWPKTHPARHECQQLGTLGCTLTEDAGSRWLVNTDYGTFSTLICSELLDVEERGRLRGRIDVLLVPSWNPDTATFDHTVQTTANDLHCYSAIANNARFSDCRVQTPAYKQYERDACRLICRDEVDTVSCALDVEKLRAFQRRSVDSVNVDSKEFKPIPPGFQYRRP